MSAGWKKNSTPGKRCGSIARSLSHEGLRRRVAFSSSAICISPSSVPIVPALLYDRLMPL